MSTPTLPPAVVDLLATAPPMPLGPGTPDRSVGDRIRTLDLPAVRDAVAARACLAGLWLRFNHLDESHTLSQDIHTAEGSAWHAVMHRREPDAWNSKYWWRRVGNHPVLDRLREHAPALGYAYTSPFEFVDFCEKARGSGSGDEELAQRVQLLEWQLLFDWCFRRAVGAG
jgi:hypothetical protein